MESLMVAVQELEPQVRPLVERLMWEGITILQVYEGDINTDAGVELDDDYTIQICQDGVYCLIKEDDYIFESESLSEFVTVVKEFV